MTFRSTTAVAVALLCGLSVTGASAQGLGGVPAIAGSGPYSPVQKVGGRGVALGVGALIGTAIILSEAARAEGHRRYRADSYCGHLLFDCEDGIRRACYRYEDRCR